MENIILETERLYVKSWTLEDINGLYNIMSDEKVHIYTGDNIWSKERAKSYIEFNMNRQKLSLDDFHGAIILKETKEIIGLAGLNPYIENVPEIEWQLGSRFWNQGYATEIGKAIIEATFKNTNVTKIYGMANPENKGSIKVMEKIGMTSIGIKEFRDEKAMFYEIIKK